MIQINNVAINPDRITFMVPEPENGKVIIFFENKSVSLNTTMVEVLRAIENEKRRSLGMLFPSHQTNEELAG